MSRTSADSTRSTRIRRASVNRREQRKRDLRHSILQAATTEFLEYGYENFSLRRVAERVGYTPTTIYLYFQNKDDLLLATVQDGFAAFDASVVATSAETSDPLQRIEALGRAYIDFGLKNPALYRLMFMQRSDIYLMPRLIGKGTDDVEAVTATETAYHRVIAQEHLVAAVEAAMSAKQIPPGDALLLADALWASVHGLVALAISPLMHSDHAPQVADQMLKLLINGLRVKS